MPLATSPEQREAFPAEPHAGRLMRAGIAAHRSVPALRRTQNQEVTADA